MNILYLHGLKSRLKPEKKNFLENFGTVLAPDIDYDKAHLQPVDILRALPDTEINVVMGSSMGGLNAYAIAELIGRPALLFNPPLSKYQPLQGSFKPQFPTIDSFKQLLLGGSDDVVAPKQTLIFLSQHLQENELFLHIDPRLGHRIPMDLFEEQVTSFFSKLCY